MASESRTGRTLHSTSRDRPRIQFLERRTRPSLKFLLLIGASHSLTLRTLSFVSGRSSVEAESPAAAAPGGSDATPLLPELLRRDVLWAGLGWSVSLSTPPAHAKGEKWRTDIPRVLAALKVFQKEWPSYLSDDSMNTGALSAGANRVRAAMVKEYVDRYDISIPVDKPLDGAVSSRGMVSSKASPEFGWKEGDMVVQINAVPLGQATIDLASVQAQAKEAGKGLVLTVERRGPPLFVDFEKQLLEAYAAVGDEGLPDLEELQTSIGGVEFEVATAASATQVSLAVMQSLRKLIDKLAEQLTLVAKAIG
ncbi:unnamed protein product [Polarella glacialis]|uniref:PDZ domain-containing protein n=1 Tax=Polarella glacialis TaxID=89957 RepID=A0A813D8F8_POLGL|nr:unnamed protein product [Polarella glacialis]